jgi:hypothetical protein
MPCAGGQASSGRVFQRDLGPVGLRSGSSYVRAGACSKELWREMWPDSPSLARRACSSKRTIEQVIYRHSAADCVAHNFS